MIAMTSRLAALLITLSIFVGVVVAHADEKTKDPDIVINITGPGAGAKYIKDGDAEEKEVIVKVGQTVRWVNKGTVSHTATSFLKAENKPVFDTDVIDADDSADVKFDGALFTKAGGKAGGEVELKYFCRRHPAQMKNGKILFRDH